MPEETKGSPTAFLLAWAISQVHERIVTLVADLSDDQLSWAPQARAHSLAFTLWHIARCDDNYMRVHIQGRPEIWQEEGWHHRLGLDQESTGMLISDEEAYALRLPGKQELLAYARRVWDEVSTSVQGLGPEESARPVNQVERTRGLTVEQVIITHIYGHDNRHLGEMEYLKGLLGLRGSVTL